MTPITEWSIEDLWDMYWKHAGHPMSALPKEVEKHAREIKNEIKRCILNEPDSKCIRCNISCEITLCLACCEELDINEIRQLLRDYRKPLKENNDNE